MSAARDRLAIISNIHGNLPALEAVLADIGNRSIKTIYCLGDLIGKGPDGAEAVDICRDRCVATLRGNWDEWTAGAGEHPTHHWNRERLGPERLGWLRDLPGTAEFQISGQQVRLFRASQQSVHHRVRQYDAPAIHAQMFDNTDFTGAGRVPDIVGYGDIHIAYVKTLPHKTLFNAGSVGNPLDMPLASYAVLEGDYGGDAATPWGISIVRVPYDIERAIAQAEASGMPDLPEYASELRTARYRGLK
jgi:predicted phosphodiesterase